MLREIEFRRPDPDGPPGWDEIRMVCGHIDCLPSDVKISSSHCGQCQLDNEAHLAKMAAITRKLEQEQLKAAVTEALGIVDGPDDPPGRGDR